MRYFKFLFIIGLILVPFTLEETTQARESKQDVQDLKILTKCNAEFALSFYNTIKSKKGNLIFSPYSISNAFAMSYAGADGVTKKQMGEAFHFTNLGDKLHTSFLKLDTHLKNLEDKSPVQLNIANAIWAQRGYPFIKNYMDILEKYYGAKIRTLDFIQNPLSAGEIINNWVEKETKNKIKKLIPPRLLNELTRLVITNAIYFKGKWASEFDTTATKEMPFYLINGSINNTPMMQQIDEFQYAELDKLKLLEMSYVGENLSMLILLPKENDNLSWLENNLTLPNLERWIGQLQNAKVNVFFPVFKFEKQINLVKDLKKMGIHDAFDSKKANFTRMDGRMNKLYISAAIHKAYIDVNEEGTEAAAATAIVHTLKSAPPTKVHMFKADHPFIFIIRERIPGGVGNILFLGQVENPVVPYTIDKSSQEQESKSN